MSKPTSPPPESDLPAAERERLALLTERLAIAEDIPVHLLGPSADELIESAKKAIAEVRVGKKVKYTPSDIIRAAVAYSITGSVKKSASLTNIPIAQVRTWSHERFWNDCLRVARYYSNIEYDSKIRQVANLTVNRLIEKLEQNKLEGRELVALLEKVDKVQTSSEQRITQDTDKEEAKDVLKTHLEEMRKLLQAQGEKLSEKIIEGEVIDRG